MVEKYAYALIIEARKLRPDFHAHTIKVLTDKPLRQVLEKPDTSSWLVKWSIELGEYDIKYEARPAIKSQVLVDFMGDNAPAENTSEEDSSKSDENEKGIWKLSVDGSSCISGSGAGLVLTSLNGTLRDLDSKQHTMRRNGCQANYSKALGGSKT
ncbi:hypothetical protein CFOL_v3_14008 [Cephalotus follicularis]|uniref:Reverse transcriptase RNase H-like domain-containing protein n=1 Tax=Cephalotus follicularis TaxID=3775 RepID=A0A1Q3BR72_CEPFO|nr:hypothetical protein CFOL_v3_14008 [Cephalotus follicularis]